MLRFIYNNVKSEIFCSCILRIRGRKPSFFFHNIPTNKTKGRAPNTSERRKHCFGRQCKAVMQNKVYLNGSIIRKNYDSRSGRLYLMMTVYNRTRNKEYVDHPVIVFDGEEAKRIDASIPEVSRNRSVLAEIVGHLTTENYMRRIRSERNRYERIWRQMIVGDSLEIVSSVRSKNEVTIVGEVRNVWRNPEEGKRFYMITFAVGQDAFTTIYFDHKMELEPKTGETLKCDAVIHTRVVRDGNRRITEFSVNAWRIARIENVGVTK